MLLTRVKKKKMLDRSRVSLGISTWLSSGETDWNHDASPTSSLLGNPSSELIYEDLKSNIIELEARLELPNRYFARGNYGFGSINEGRLVDDDYLSPTGALLFSTEERFSRTHSNIDSDNVWYLNFDFGKRLIRSKRGWVGGFIGFQHWEENVVGQSIKTIECPNTLLCNPVGSVTNIEEKVISNSVVWNSIKIGLDVEYRVNRRISISGQLAYIPLAIMDNDDIHHLRTDLQQNPSFKMEGKGSGLNFKTLARVRLIGDFFLTAGFRYWKLTVNDEEWKNYTVSGEDTIANLNNFDSVRFGTILGLSYRF